MSELEVYYQPIIDLRDSHVVGAEALVRWNRRGVGMIPAIEFIEIAESTQLIIPLGEWVLNQACAQAQQWRDRRIVDETFFMSVNLSPLQLGGPRHCRERFSGVAVFGAAGELIGVGDHGEFHFSRGRDRPRPRQHAEILGGPARH